MSGKRCQQYLIAACLFIEAASITQAQGPPPATPPQGRTLGLNDEVMTLLEQMLAAYRETDAYQDRGRISIQQANGRVVQTTRMPASITLRRPNLIRQVGGGQLVTCDGVTLQIVLDGLGQYTNASAPKTLNYADISIAAAGGGVDEGYPDVTEFLLLGDKVLLEWTRRIRQIELAKDAVEIDGHLCSVVRYATVYDARVDMYIDQERHVLLRSLIDLTDAQSAGGISQPVPRKKPTMTIQYDLFPVQLGGDIDPDVFAVQPPDEMQLVKQFQQPGADRSRGSREFGESVAPGLAGLAKELHGKTTPKLKGADFDGEPFSMEELDNRVTIVFLWAPNAGFDCLRALTLVQEVADQFHKDPRVRVLGISGEADNIGAIVALTRVKEITFRNLLDHDNLTMRAFGVQGLPLTLVVGPDRTIRKAWYGFPAERSEQLVEAIDAELERMDAIGVEARTQAIDNLSEH